MSDIEKEMIKRIEDYLKAKNEPTARIHKKEHTADPNFVTPEPKICKRYDQLNEEKDGCSVEYTEDPNRQGSVNVHVSVEDEENL